jgi:xanthosine utilization system XapX-like protein
MNHIPKGVSKARSQVTGGLVFGLLVGLLTASLTLVIPVIPAIVIGGLGLGIVTRLYFRVWPHGEE